MDICIKICYKQIIIQLNTFSVRSSAAKMEVFNYSTTTNKTEKTFKKNNRPFQNLPLNSPWLYSAPHNYVPNKNPRNIYVEDCTVPKNEVSEMAPDALKEANIVTQQKNNAIKNLHENFEHFSRLMQLFPKISPAVLHTISISCNNDFTETVDILLRRKSMHSLDRIRAITGTNNQAKVKSNVNGNKSIQNGKTGSKHVQLMLNENNLVSPAELYKKFTNMPSVMPKHF